MTFHFKNYLQEKFSILSTDECVCVIMSEMVSRVLKPLLRAAQTQLSQ